MSSSQPKHTSQTTTQEPSKFIKPYLSKLFGGAQATAAKGYQPYGGQRIAGFSQNELASRAGVRGLYDQGPRPELAFGMGQLNKAGRVAGDTGRYTKAAMDSAGQTQGFTGRSAGLVDEASGYAREAAAVGRDPGRWNQQAFQEYSSPYFEDVLEIQKRNARDEAMRSMNAMGANMGSAGSPGFGSMRHGLMQSELMGTSQQLLSDIEAKGRQQAWENSLSAFQSDRDARLEGGRLQLESGRNLMQGGDQALVAGQLGLDAGQLQIAAGQLGVSAADLMTSISQEARVMADTQQGQALERLTALEASGASQREMEQAIKDMAYSDFIEKRDWKQNQQSWLAGIIQGFPMPFSNTQTTSAPGPSMGSQIGGLAALGLGGYQAWKNS